MLNENQNKSLKVVSDPDAKRRCPYCQSNKWKWIKTLPTTVDTIGKYLLMKFVCEKCGNEFLAKEKAQAKFVKSAEKCVYCNSKNIKKISRPNADIELYFCNQCHCYMGIKQDRLKP